MPVQRKLVGSALAKRWSVLTFMGKHLHLKLCRAQRAKNETEEGGDEDVSADRPIAN